MWRSRDGASEASGEKIHSGEPGRRMDGPTHVPIPLSPRMHWRLAYHSTCDPRPLLVRRRSPRRGGRRAGAGSSMSLACARQDAGVCKGSWARGEERLAGVCGVHVARRVRLSWLGLDRCSWDRVGLVRRCARVPAAVSVSLRCRSSHDTAQREAPGVTVVCIAEVIIVGARWAHGLGAPPPTIHPLIIPHCADAGLRTTLPKQASAPPSSLSR